jgi:hypothetical protein
MSDTTLPTWYTELAPEVPAEISAFLRAKGRQLARLQQKVDDQARIIENRNSDITRLEGDVARLQRELDKKPPMNRTADQLFAELLDWYNAADLFLFRVKAIGEKYLSAAPANGGQPADEDHTHE